jgi:hypothetical protein
LRFQRFQEGIAVGLGAALEYIGGSLDKPGRAVRGFLGGKPQELLAAVPFSDTLGLTNPSDRVSGRDLTNKWGLTSPSDRSWNSSIAGFGADIATDPLNLIPGHALYKAGKSAWGLGKFNKAQQAATHTDELYRALVPSLSRGPSSPSLRTDYLDALRDPSTQLGRLKTLADSAGVKVFPRAGIDPAGDRNLMKHLNRTWPGVGDSELYPKSLTGKDILSSDEAFLQAARINNNAARAKAHYDSNTQWIYPQTVDVRDWWFNPGKPETWKMSSDWLDAEQAAAVAKHNRSIGYNPFDYGDRTAVHEIGHALHHKRYADQGYGPDQWFNMHEDNPDWLRAWRGEMVPSQEPGRRVWQPGIGPNGGLASQEISERAGADPHEFVAESFAKMHGDLASGLQVSPEATMPKRLWQAYNDVYQGPPLHKGLLETLRRLQGGKTASLRTDYLESLGNPSTPLGRLQELAKSTSRGISVFPYRSGFTRSSVRPPYDLRRVLKSDKAFEESMRQEFGVRHPGAYALYDADIKQIAPNFHDPYAVNLWMKPELMAEEMKRMGPGRGSWLSTSDPNHLAVHEIGHGLHHKVLDDMGISLPGNRWAYGKIGRELGVDSKGYYKADPRLVGPMTYKVSGYAADHPWEFVPEAYAKMIHDMARGATRDFSESLSPELNDIYRSLGGPNPEQSGGLIDTLRRLQGGKTSSLRTDYFDALNNPKSVLANAKRMADTAGVHWFPYSGEHGGGMIPKSLSDQGFNDLLQMPPKWHAAYYPEYRSILPNAYNQPERWFSNYSTNPLYHGGGSLHPLADSQTPIHEIGHALHHLSAGNQFPEPSLLDRLGFPEEDRAGLTSGFGHWWAKDLGIGNEIDRTIRGYASTNPHEFVADSYSKMAMDLATRKAAAQSEALSPELNYFYNRLLGPRVTPEVVNEIRRQTGLGAPTAMERYRDTLRNPEAWAPHFEAEFPTASPKTYFPAPQGGFLGSKGEPYDWGKAAEDLNSGDWHNWLNDIADEDLKTASLGPGSAASTRQVPSTGAVPGGPGLSTNLRPLRDLIPVAKEGHGGLPTRVVGGHYGQDRPGAMSNLLGMDPLNMGASKPPWSEFAGAGTAAVRDPGAAREEILHSMISRAAHENDLSSLPMLGKPAARLYQSALQNDSRSQYGLAMVLDELAAKTMSGRGAAQKLGNAANFLLNPSQHVAYHGQFAPFGALPNVAYHGVPVAAYGLLPGLAASYRLGQQQ